MNEILNETKLKIPGYYHRDYANDIPAPSKHLSWSEQSNIERIQRVANVALPFVTLYKPLGLSISLGLGAMRTLSTFAQLISSIQEGDVGASAYQLLQASVAVASVAGTIFAHPLGMLITTGQDLLIATGSFAMHLKEGEYKKAAEDGLGILNNFLYLVIFTHGSLELSIVSLGMQVLLSIYHSQEELREGRYLEAVGHVGMTAIRSRQMAQQIQFLQFLNKTQELRNKLMLNIIYKNEVKETGLQVSSTETFDCLKTTASIESANASELLACTIKYEPGGSSNVGRYPPHLAAAYHGDIQALRVFLKYGLDPNTPCQGQCPLPGKSLLMNIVAPYYYFRLDHQPVPIRSGELSSTYYPKFLQVQLQVFDFLIENGARFSAHEYTAIHTTIKRFEMYKDLGIASIKKLLLTGVKEQDVISKVASDSSIKDMNYKAKAVQLLIDFGFKY